MLATTAAMIEQFNKRNILILKTLGYEVHIAGNFKVGNPIPAERLEQFKNWIEQNGGRWVHIPASRNPFDVRGNRDALKRVLQLIQDNRYLFIHCHTPIGSVIGRSAAHITGVPIIYTAHGFHFFRGAPAANWLLYYPVERAMSHWTDVLITITKEDYERARRSFHAGRTEYIRGVGIDTGAFSPNRQGSGGVKQSARNVRTIHKIPEDAILLLSVGEVNRNKNHRIVINALSQFQDSRLYYVICGKGQLITEYQEIIRKAGLDGHIILAGYCENMQDYYRAADIYVHPSRREGISVAIMEAMASGLPVICSDIRGSRDLVKAGVNGLLVHNRVREWKTAIKTLAGSTKLREKYGRNAIIRISAFDQSRIDEKMKEIYLSLSAHGGS